MKFNNKKYIMVSAVISLVFVIAQLVISVIEQLNQDKLILSFPDKQMGFSPVSIYNGTLLTTCDNL